MTRPGLFPHLTRPLVALAVLGVLAAGCAKAGGTPTQSHYVGVADQVCESHKDEIGEIEAENAAEPDPARAERWIRAELVPEYRDMLDALRGIRPPEGDETYLASLYADLEHEVMLLQARPSDGPAKVRQNEDLRRRFASYGMKVCGRV